MSIERLTSDEIQEIRKSWEPVKVDMEPVGKLLFQVMFEKFPEYKELFMRMKEGDKELMESQRFVKHAVNNVMVSFSTMIDNLDNEQELEKLVRDLGARHFKRKVTQKHFEAIISLLQETLRRGLGSAFNTEVERIWMKMLNITMREMGKACEAAGSN